MTFTDGIMLLLLFGGAFGLWNLSDLVEAKEEEIRERTRKLKLENDREERRIKQEHDTAVPSAGA
ncbi:MULTISPECIES: hypothetical protein [Nitrospirillum]|uniref:Uncharacterized protein n=1 Tax=Nitrospirillum amazonense TaxID=28077 RepID=A0A560GDQ0_9PROT|nr:hypothetical protein [Nitrospirillum amazonense]MEC4594289.1 hypothetical protein [Nitrospirillum amazonense]TWB31810.1 hypothetical protein FBZ88_101180 [Nitrospirillum amazonense]